MRFHLLAGISCNLVTSLMLENVRNEKFPLVLQIHVQMKNFLTLKYKDDNKISEKNYLLLYRVIYVGPRPVMTSEMFEWKRRTNRKMMEGLLE